MTPSPRVVTLAASLREGSFNRRLVRIAADGLDAAGAVATRLDLRDYPLPLYDADLEKWDGLPRNALALKEVFAAHDAILFALPEYNGSVTPLFKNTIDWASRPTPGEKTGLAWARNKPCALVSASNGALGGLRGLYHARWVLQTCGLIVIPQQKALSRAATAFDANGDLVDTKERDAVYRVAAALVELTAKLVR
ncbi:MAG TPA: NADPH-dependent FMN reductase [Candidatus Krumholzibacteria bacterium]|nr:NADPH-dependent FMN reductase [Candidatus Krumholzibacteria bacterium]